MTWHRKHNMHIKCLGKGRESAIMSKSTEQTQKGILWIYMLWMVPSVRTVKSSQFTLLTLTPGQHKTEEHENDQSDLLLSKTLGLARTFHGKRPGREGNAKNVVSISRRSHPLRPHGWSPLVNVYLMMLLRLLIITSANEQKCERGTKQPLSIKPAFRKTGLGSVQLL